MLLAAKFGAVGDKEEHLARNEKAAALKELAESRLSVLIGSAGAGKTSLLGILCAQQEIMDGGLLLLTPTGKVQVIVRKQLGG